MTKARILADLISDNAELADGQISVAEVVGAAPLANPNFTGTVTSTGNVNVNGQVRGVDRYYFKRASDSYSLSALARWDGTNGSPLTGTAGVNTVVGSEEASSSVIFAPSNVEKMRIDSGGRVGIGTVPNTNMHVATFPGTLAIGDQGVVFGNADSLQLGNNYYWGGSSFKYLGTGKASRNYHTTGNIVWDTTDSSGSANGTLTFSERMRLDASGNLLVGTTNLNPQSSSSESGMRIGDGFMFAGRSGEVAILNRQGSDGCIAEFRKDGSSVAKIGTKSGNSYIGSGDTALKFLAGSDAVVAATAADGSGRADAIDLGQSGNAFKDLYLSGGVDFGGAVNAGGVVSSSNKLDDYEEGVYAYTISGASSGTDTPRVNYAYLSYTRIGRMVKVMGRYEVSASSGANGNLQFSLPFTQSNSLTDQADAGVGTISIFRSGTQFETVLRAVVYPGNNFFNVLRQTGTNSEGYISGSDVDSNYEGFLEVTMLVD